jgi:Xaa-Pro aminopeptidase
MKSRRFLAWVAIAAFSVAAAPKLGFANDSMDAKNEPRAIRVAPPAPRISDAERQAELGRRRQQVAARMGANSMMILMSAEPKIYAGDVDYEYRQENNLYYLTALKQKGATLVLLPGNAATPEILFLPKRDPANETWNGKMYSREDATRLSGVKTILDASEFAAFVEALKKREAYASPSGVSVSAAQNLFLLLPKNQLDRDGKREYRQEIEFATTLQGAQPSLKIQNAQEDGKDIFGDLRLIKSPMEQRILQHSIDITTEAFGRAMGAVGRAKYEYEVEAEVEYTFRRRNADYWGYPSIVGCGPNATTLHYNESQSEVRAGDLLLMDVGAEYDHYTADVTRTFPVNGKFSKEQAEIYQIVYDAQEAAMRETKPGARFQTLSQAAAKTIAEGLAKLGLITAPNATLKIRLGNGQTFDAPQYRLWYMHGLGHWLGMNVHDVGDYSKPLAPGMVFTNEPGIYIRGDALDYLEKTPETEAFLAKVRPAFEKYKNIGVRIEDDILVTDSGAEWMTKNLPRKMNEIEDLMARAAKEMPVIGSTRTFQWMKTRVLWDSVANGFAPEKLFGLNEENLSGKTVRRGFVSVGSAAKHNHFHQHSHHGE